MKRVPLSSGIALKKKYGQHFLRSPQIVQEIVDAVDLDKTSSVFEIGPGEGVLTQEILTRPIARLWAFEIDSDWVEHLKETIKDERFTVFYENFLDIDFSPFRSYVPWTLLANLPYQVTFPILHKLQEHRDLLKEGVVMMQEEVAQKIVKTSGRGYGFPSLFFQYYFDWKLMRKIPPTAFFPPPKVDSRLLYFKPKKDLKPIPDESDFWKFIKICFRQPRRTLRNNLAHTHYAVDRISDDTLALRAQQMSMEDFLQIWEALRVR